MYLTYNSQNKYGDPENPEQEIQDFAMSLGFRPVHIYSVYSNTVPQQYAYVY